ncbi:MAG: hypothetical protein M3Q47_19520 [Actinomycetota bacterium]|nr:hypothetical protein [Actinomycetota bacterium]
MLGDRTAAVREGTDVLRSVGLGGAVEYAVAGRPRPASLPAWLVGAALPVVSARFGRGSVRRIPGVTAHEARSAWQAP